MISSKTNPKIVHIRSLLNQRTKREESGEFVVEGVRLCEEAASAGIPPRTVLFNEGVSERGKELIANFAKMGSQAEEVPFEIMSSISGTNTSQGILAVVPFPNMPSPPKVTFLVIADTIHDPGNLGTLLRSAASAGVDEFIVTPGSVDPWSPKVVRSGMGAHFHLPIRELDWGQISYTNRARVLLADMDGESMWDTDLTEPLALVIGGEAEGASEPARRAATGRISIPMPGKSESLNAAIAGSILIFEVFRQRRK